MITKTSAVCTKYPSVCVLVLKTIRRLNALPMIVCTRSAHVSVSMRNDLDLLDDDPSPIFTAIASKPRQLSNLLTVNSKSAGFLVSKARRAD